jgi:hypothetical protein
MYTYLLVVYIPNGILSDLFVFLVVLACFHYFEKNRVGLWDHVAICLCVRVSPVSFLGNGSVETLPR